MSASIHGQMVYSFEKPMWHNITEPSLVPHSAQEVLDKKFGGGFEIFLRPVVVELNHVLEETGDFAIVRGVSPADYNEVVFGYCSDRYHPLQPRDVAISFDNNVKEPAETMAFLGKGDDMFISWKMPSFEIMLDDRIELFGIVRTGFDTLKGTRLFTSIYRPVCANTITLAEGWANGNHDKNSNRGMIWKGRGVNKNLLRDLGYWMAHVQEKAKSETELLRTFLEKLAETPIQSEGEAYIILDSAFPNAPDVSSHYPPQLREKKAEVIKEYNEGQNEIRQGIYRLFAGEGTAITPTYWGMLNATSEYFCHVQPSKRPIAESVMFGARAKNTMKMVEVLSDFTK